MPVSIETLIAFIAASTVLLVIPGPTIVMVVSQTIAYGRQAALASVAGVALGDLVAASLSILGVGTLLAVSATIFTAIKWLGAGYLIFIGWSMWRTRVAAPDAIAGSAALPGPETHAHSGAPASRSKLFRHAFLVTVLNPKGIVFFMAFVPQFIDHRQPFAPQAGIFVAVFVALGIVNAYAYVLAASSARAFLRRPAILGRVTKAGGLFLMGAGAASLLTRQTA